MRPFASLTMLAPLILFTGLTLTPVAVQALVVPLDHSTRLSVQGAAASVVVGNPAIADVTVVDSRTVYVLGRGLGSTNVVVLDQLGRTLLSSEVDVTASGSNVSIYRGAKLTTVACNPGCNAADHPAAQARLGGDLADVFAQRSAAATSQASTPTPGVPAAFGGTHP